MSDDDWGVDTEEKPVAEDKKEEPKEQPAKEEENKEEEKKAEENDDVENDANDSWIVQKPKVQTETRGRGSRSPPKIEEKRAVVEEKAEELKPDQEESFWGDAKAPAETEKDKTEQNQNGQRPGRGRGNREGQEETGRGNRNNFDRNYRNNDAQQNNDGEQRGRGNRDGGNRDGEWRGRGGGFNRGGDRGDRGGYRGDRGDRGDRGGDRGERGGYRGDRGERWDQGQRGGDGDRGRGRGRGGFYNNGNRNFNQGENNAQATNEVVIPKARKCWPECSIYIFGVKLGITFRKIQDFKCKLLIVPFKTTRLQLYPGNIVNQSKVNYKEKLINKEEMKNGGEVYFQKAHEIAGFEAIAFLKVDQSKLEESLTNGIKLAFERISGISQANLQSVVFSFSDELGSPLHVIKEVIKSLQETEKVKNFYINTNNSKCFLECINSFKDEMQYLFDENQVSIE